MKNDKQKRSAATNKTCGNTENNTENQTKDK